MNTQQNIVLLYSIGQPVQSKGVEQADRDWMDCPNPSFDFNQYNYRLSGKPTFDVQRALSCTKTVNRLGEEIRIITYVPEATGDEYPVVALDRNEMIFYTKDGSYHATVDSDMDLFMLPTFNTYWVNLYDGDRFARFLTQADADIHSNGRLPRFGGKAWPITVRED